MVIFSSSRLLYWEIHRMWLIEFLVVYKILFVRGSIIQLVESGAHRETERDEKVGRMVEEKLRALTLVDCEPS